MQLEDYFDFLADNDIRLKGTRVGIETVLYDYIYDRKSPETIAHTYPTITLEQVYATIIYFLHYQGKVTQYMADWLQYCEESERQFDENPPPHLVKLAKLKAQNRQII